MPTTVYLPPEIQTNNCTIVNNCQHSLFLVSGVILYSLEANHYQNDVVAMCLANLSSFTYTLTLNENESNRAD